MYYYYLLSTLGKRPWWGAYMTRMQLVQFVIMIAHGAYSLYAGCEYPPRVMGFYVAYIAIMLVLFGQFYVAKYCKGDKGKAAAAAAVSTDDSAADTGKSSSVKGAASTAKHRAQSERKETH